MKKIPQVVVSAAITAPLVFLLVRVSGSPAIHNPFFAFCLNLFVMVWVVVNAGVWRLHLSLGPRYYHIRAFEKNGRIYKSLGIRLLKKLLRRGPLSILNPELRLSEGRSALSKLDQKMRDAETGHVVVFATMLTITAYPVLQGWWKATAWWLLFNVLINIYPVMLQRYNRARLELLVDRLERSRTNRQKPSVAK
jgi:hypothetical protein